MSIMKSLLSKLGNPYKIVETSYYKTRAGIPFTDSKDEFVKIQSTETSSTSNTYTETFYNAKTNIVKIKKHFFGPL